MPTAAPFAACLLVSLLAATASAGAAADPAVVALGAGGYLNGLPAGAKGPPDAIFATENVRSKMPTNDWWSSLAWEKFSHPHYPHPLAADTGPAGLRVFYPGPNVAGTKDAVFGFMPGGGKGDLVLGLADAPDFDDARVDGWSDWFVRVRFGAPDHRMTVSYGHGSPFVYATFQDSGGARIAFEQPPKIWAGDATTPVLGVSVGAKHYALFGPTGSTWDGLGGKALTNRPGGKTYFSLAVLPEPTQAALDLFRRYAYAHVTDTTVAWAYDPKTAAVTTTFAFTTKAYEPSPPGAEGTLFALYPHQWRHAATPLLPHAYPSVRGTMKLAAGATFATTVKFPGVLPALPRVEGGADPARLAAYLRRDMAVKLDPADVKDTYWDGKQLGRLACLVPIAEQYGLNDEAAATSTQLRERLEAWLTAAAPAGARKQRRAFAYDERWGTLIGYPASYGSDVELNDHHFHYGYFLRAAAEVARGSTELAEVHDPKWAADERFGGMVKLIARDIASGDRADPLFPLLRNFDPYAGHSWASGHARFGDGNNHESSSEAMNAWFGLLLWADATGDAKLRDLAAWLYATEMTAIEEYWFDVHGDNFPKGYTPSVVTMVWGGKGANGTWFSGEPEAVHGINFLPVHSGSLYLGRDVAYAKKNWDALIVERKGGPLRQWQDVLLMYRALSDPDDAIKRFEAAGDGLKPESGNSLANTYHWIYTLKALGRVDATVTADAPLAAAFVSGTTRTYAAYSGGKRPGTVRFSTGFSLRTDGSGWAVGKETIAGPR